MFLFVGVLNGQVILPTPETAFELQHNFNPEVIKTKGIKKITFDIIDKNDYEVAVDKSLTENYEFTAEGMLARYYYTSISKIVEKQVTRVGRKGQRFSETFNEYVFDTVSTSYFYSAGRLILKRFHNGLNYYESRYYRYDSAGNLTKELRFKETNNSQNPSVFILGNQVLLSEDSFQYQKYSSGQVKCTFLNNENRPYKERITNYDSLGRKKTVSEHYTAASWIMQEMMFEYSGKDLAVAKFEGNANKMVRLKNTYEFDENKELYTEKQYRDSVLLKEISYVTSRADTLLSSIVIRDPINKTIRIVKLRYDLGMIGKSDR
ncbi:MAG: hypothetical protein PSX36_16490 [bacterium]|nr:hypothetical protein [bacterium]